MPSRKKTLITALVVGLVTGTVAVMTTPKAPEACLAFREALKQQVLSENTLSGLLSSIPEGVLDKAVEERYGTLTAEQCGSEAARVTQATEALGRTPWAPKMPQAAKASVSAMTECRQKRISGELPSHAASAECSNAAIIKAYETIHYPYMDLVRQYTDLKREEAGKVDASMIESTEDTMPFARLALTLAEEERKRAAQAH